MTAETILSLLTGALLGVGGVPLCRLRATQKNARGDWRNE